MCYFGAMNLFHVFGFNLSSPVRRHDEIIGSAFRLSFPSDVHKGGKEFRSVRIVRTVVHRERSAEDMPEIVTSVQGIVQQDVPGIVQEHVPGIVQHHVPGIVQEHVPGIVQEHVPGIVQQHVPGIVRQHVPGIVQEHVPGIVQHHVQGIVQ